MLAGRISIYLRCTPDKFPSRFSIPRSPPPCWDSAPKSHTPISCNGSTAPRLAKAHTFTNWSARPLSTDQIAYAAEDVQFLLPLHTHLQKRLHALGRTEWVREEFSRLETAVTEKSKDPLDRYQRIRGWDSLKPKQAAILRDLAAWRETEARRRNVPRGRVMRDEVLLQLARHPPATVEELRGLRGLHGGEIDRNGEQLIATITASLALPPSAWPQVPRDRKPEPESIGLVELLQAVLKARAAEAGNRPHSVGHKRGPSGPRRSQGKAQDAGLAGLARMAA